MSRKLRAFLALALVSFAFTAAACTDSSTAPRLNADQGCDTSGSNVCH